MPEFRSYRTEAIVLKHSDWGETDRILTLFSREHGKLRVVARGVRKIRSRRAGHLEPFMQVSLQLAKSKDLPIVTQADTIEAYLPLREDLVSIARTSYVVELLDRFTYQEGENGALFRLLQATLQRLSAAETDPAVVLRYYEIRLLDLSGFRPELFKCVVCGEEIKPEKQFFSARLGGIVCPRSAVGVQDTTPASVEALRYLRHFQRSSFKDAGRAAPDERTRREMELLMQHYITYVLERGLNTPRFLRKVSDE